MNKTESNLAFAGTVKKPWNACNVYIPAHMARDSTFPFPISKGRLQKVTIEIGDGCLIIRPLGDKKREAK